MKKVFIISPSIRNGSNSEILAREFERGTKEVGNKVEFLSLKNFDLKFCIGCLACQKIGRCVLNDDMKNALKKVSESDILVFATPVYYYGMSGQLKTFLDRLNPLYIKNNKFKKVYLLGTCADNDKNAFEKTEVALDGWTCCFDGVSREKSLLATSTDAPNSVSDEFKLEAYNLGKSI